MIPGTGAHVQLRGGPSDPEVDHGSPTTCPMLVADIFRHGGSEDGWSMLPMVDLQVTGSDRTQASFCGCHESKPRCADGNPVGVALNHSLPTLCFGIFFSPQRNV